MLLLLFWSDIYIQYIYINAIYMCTHTHTLYIALRCADCSSRIVPALLKMYWQHYQHTWPIVCAVSIQNYVISTKGRYRKHWINKWTLRPFWGKDPAEPAAGALLHLRLPAAAAAAKSISKSLVRSLRGSFVRREADASEQIEKTFPKRVQKYLYLKHLQFWITWPSINR